MSCKRIVRISGFRRAGRRVILERLFSLQHNTAARFVYVRSLHLLERANETGSVFDASCVQHVRHLGLSVLL